MDIDKEAIDKFRLKLRIKVRYHVGRFCPDEEDLVQETLVRFLRFAEDDRIRNLDNVGAFLNGVCKNVIMEYRRRLWREEPYDLEFREDGCAKDRDTELLEVREAVEAGLAQLSERDHAILRAFYLEEKTRDEICNTLGATDTQFRVALFRAKQRFRKIYHESVKQRTVRSH
jgi:RNA polymerase sigma-70 factor (ECF subfamily)